MEVSSTSMNVASVTVKAISHGLYFGFQGASRVSVTPFFFGAQTLARGQAKIKWNPLNSSSSTLSERPTFPAAGGQGLVAPA